MGVWLHTSNGMSQERFVLGLRLAVHYQSWRVESCGYVIASGCDTTGIPTIVASAKTLAESAARKLLREALAELGEEPEKESA